MNTPFKVISVGLMLCLFLGECEPLYSQEAESKTVEFLLNNVPDREPPVIKIISPVLTEDNRYLTDQNEVDLIGEATDESKIRFVSVNTEIRMVNETGIFVSSLFLSPGENQIQIRSLDEHNNLRNMDIIIEYHPTVLSLADRIMENSNYYGLFIAIDEYQDEKIPDLENPIKDAERLIKTLTTKYAFTEENIMFLKNPTRNIIIRELDELRRKVNDEDNLLIFYAGHGIWDQEANIGYWLPSDASRESTVDWFRNSTLVNYLKAIHSKHTLLITDACFAGSIFKARSVNLDAEVVYERLYEIPSRKAMTSGLLDEVPDQSAFLDYLIQRLDDNEEMYLSSEELFSSFRMAVISNSKVVPQYGVIQDVGNEGGDFIFLRKR